MATPKAAPAEPSRQPSPQVAALLKKANCASCHGANYSKPIDPTYPKIAGQHADYLYVALKAYRTSGNPHASGATTRSWPAWPSCTRWPN